jgi:hypothetical protein
MQPNEPAENMAEIKEALKQQQEFNKLQIEKLAEQERYIKEVLDNQDLLSFCITYTS